jgi:hypothetical protein
MTSSRKALLVSLALLAGCGNYSNEDLEFMSALPQRADLTVEMPARRSAVTLLEEAELARTTRATTRDLNNLTAILVGLVDLIRSYPPTTRTRDSRVWGPFGPGPTETVNRDFLRRMIVTRDALDPNVFDYEIAVHKIGSADTEWPVFLRGSFDAGAPARRGNGHLEVILADVRAAGLNVDDWQRLDHLEIDYRNPRPAIAQDPIHILMHITNLDDDPTDATPAPTATYDYRETAEGQGQMTFDVFSNIVLVTPQLEHVNITSLWFPDGEGRAQLTVEAGDGVGAQQTECWDHSFRPTFNAKPWMPAENVGTDSSVCPVIPALSAPAF